MLDALYLQSKAPIRLLLKNEEDAAEQAAPSAAFRQKRGIFAFHTMVQNPDI